MAELWFKNGSKQAVREVWMFLEIEDVLNPLFYLQTCNALLIQEMQ